MKNWIIIHHSNNSERKKCRSRIYIFIIYFCAFHLMYIYLFNHFFSRACLIINFYVLIMYNTPRQPAGIFSFFYCPGSEPLVFDPVHEIQTPSLVSAHEVCKRECCTTANLLPRRASVQRRSFISISSHSKFWNDFVRAVCLIKRHV